MQQFPTRGARQFAHRVTHRFKLHAVERAEIVFVAQQEIHVRAVHLVIDRGLDVKDVELFVDDFAETRDLVIQLRTRRVHVTVRLANSLRIVMSAE